MQMHKALQKHAPPILLRLYWAEGTGHSRNIRIIVHVCTRRGRGEQTTYLRKWKQGPWSHSMYNAAFWHQGFQRKIRSPFFEKNNTVATCGDMPLFCGTSGLRLKRAINVVCTLSIYIARQIIIVHHKCSDAVRANLQGN